MVSPLPQSPKITAALGALCEKSPPGASHWETEIWWEFLCHPMTLKSQTLAAKCCPRHPEWRSKMILKRESWIFKNMSFVFVKQNFLRSPHFPNLPQKQIKEFDQLFDITNTKKWASWLQSASQWSSSKHPKFTEFHQKIDLGSQRAAFGARSCTKAAKMVLRAPQMTHFPSDYQSSLIAGGAYPDWNLMSIPMMSPKV